jgi:hypothetical protein
VEDLSPLYGAMMHSRDVTIAIVGAALGALTLISVQAVISGGRGITKANSGATELAAPVAATHPADGDDRDPAMAANANLSEQVERYKRRLEAISAEKAATERQLAEAQTKLATIAGKDGSARARNEYDVSPEDWKKLAAEGTVKVQSPCTDMKTYDVSPSALASVGLPASDAQPIHDALWSASLRRWSTVRALCAQGLHGNLKFADDLGPEACAGLIEHMGHKDGGDLEEQTRVAAEIRAGIVPIPPDPSSLGVYTQLLLAQLSEAQQIEQQLTKSIGPDDAQAFIYGGAGCWEHFSKSAGPRPKGRP